jgi:predicted RNase H-like HicB family nuclease
MRYLVMIRQTCTGYSADVPDLPGCVAAAKTVKGVKRLIARGIELHLELMRESGERIPVPRKKLQFVIDDSVEEELCTWVEIKVPQPVS